MNEKPNQFTRRKFLLHLTALTPMAALLAFRGRLFGNLALAQGATPAATGSVALDCLASPEMTEGPYFVDELLNRSDIRSDPTDNSVKPGIPLKLAIAVFSVNGNTCSPLKDAQIDHGTSPIITALPLRTETFFVTGCAPSKRRPLNTEN